MNRIRAVVFALAIFGLGGVARAETESSSVDSLVVAQAPAHSGDDRPAMLSDIRDAEHRINTRIDGVEDRMNAKIDGVEERMNAKIDGVEERMGAKIDGVEARMDRTDAHIQELREDIRVVHIGLYSIFGALLAIVFGGLFTILVAFFKGRRAVLLPGAAVFFALVVGGAALLGYGAMESVRTKAESGESVQTPQTFDDDAETVEVSALPAEKTPPELAANRE